MSGFWDQSGHNAINLTIGDASAVSEGASWIAVLWKTQDLVHGNVRANLVSVQRSGSVVRELFSDGTGQLFTGPGDFGAGASSIAFSTTYVSAVTKAAGSHDPRFHNWAYASDGSGTMDHEDGTFALGDDGSPADAIVIGDGETLGSGTIYVVAIGTGVLSDADAETLMSPNLADWAALPGLKELIPLNDWDGVSDITSAVGSSTFASLTGTVTTDDEPSGFDYTLTSPPVSFTVGLPVETDSAFSVSRAGFASLGQAQETDIAFAISHTTPAGTTLGQAQETDAAFALVISKSMAGFSKRGVDVAGGTTATISLTTATAAQSGDLVVVAHANDFFTLATMQTPVATGTPTMHPIPGATVDGGTGHVHIKAYWYVANTAGAQTISVTETGQADEDKALIAVIMGAADIGTAIDAAASSFASASTQVAPAVTTDVASFILTIITSDVFAQQAAYGTDAALHEDTEFHIGLQSGVIASTRQDTAGTAGPYSFTVANAVGYGAATIAVIPAGGTPLGLATETDTAFALTAFVLGKTLGFPSETDDAFSVFTGTGGELGLPAESDSTFAPTYSKEFTLGGADSLVLGFAVETDEALAVAAGVALPISVTLGLPVEADTAAALVTIGASVLLFSPPTIRLVNRMGYALRTSYTRSMTVWKDHDGNWQAQSVPAYEQLKAAQRLLSVGGRPEVVDVATAAELVMAGIGTVTAIPREEAP